jgi:hypothetical protein
MSEKRTIAHNLLYDLRTDRLVFPAELDQGGQTTRVVDLSQHLLCDFKTLCIASGVNTFLSLPALSFLKLMYRAIRHTIFIF